MGGRILHPQHAAYKAGEVGAVPAEEVFERLRSLAHIRKLLTKK